MTRIGTRTKQHLKQSSDVAYRKSNRFAEKRAGQKLNFLIMFPIFFDFSENGEAGEAGESYVQLFVAVLL